MSCVDASKLPGAHGWVKKHRPNFVELRVGTPVLALCAVVTQGLPWTRTQGLPWTRLFESLLERFFYDRSALVWLERAPLKIYRYLASPWFSPNTCVLKRKERVGQRIRPSTVPTPPKYPAVQYAAGGNIVTYRDYPGLGILDRSFTPIA